MSFVTVGNTFGMSVITGKHNTFLRAYIINISLVQQSHFFRATTDDLYFNLPQPSLVC